MTFSKNLAEITPDDLGELVIKGVAEGDAVEFKLQPPGSSKDPDPWGSSGRLSDRSRDKITDVGREGMGRIPQRIPFTQADFARVEFGLTRTRRPFRANTRSVSVAAASSSALIRARLSAVSASSISGAGRADPLCSSDFMNWLHDQ